MKTNTVRTIEFERGFIRACILILGASPKWTKTERALYNKATRKLFGKKRNPVYTI